MGEQGNYDWQLATTEDDSDSPPVEVPSRFASRRGRVVLASTLQSPLQRQVEPPSGVASDNRNCTLLPSRQPPPPPCEALVRSCLANPIPHKTSPPSPEASSDSSDDCAELRRLCQSQETLTVATPLGSGFQLPQYNRFAPPSPIPERLPWSVIIDTCLTNVAPTTPKRATNEQFSSVKRSRSSPETGGLGPPLPDSRGDLQWKGPSTYSMHCTQQDQEANADSSSPTMVCYQQQDTAEVVFRPMFYSPQPSPPPIRRLHQRRLSSWIPSAHAAPLLDSAKMSSLAIMSVSSPARQRAWPYSLTFNVGLVDSHCHLDFIFNKVGHFGTYAKFRLEHSATFPECYEGCVANFCNPVTFKQYDMWDKLLSEDGVWGTFGCHPHFVREYDDEVEEHMVHALNHPSVVAFGEIGLDYSHKNQCDHKLQQDIFRRQLQLAMNRRLPLVIHSRNATQDTIRILKEVR